MRKSLINRLFLKENIYTLQMKEGNTVYESASVSSSVDPDSDTTRLWHMHLGHMSETGMT